MNEINLQAVLAAKERLAALQAELRQSHQLPVVSFTINIPGSVKDSPVIRNLLRTAVDKFRAAASDSNFDITEERFIYTKAGPAAVAAVDGEPDKLKQVGIEIEESGFYARLFDIDVFDAEGRQISRQNIGYSERTCFLCDGLPVVCRRSDKHNSDELRLNVEQRQVAFAATATNPWPETVWRIGSWAIEAMLMEAACTPAPGLVDRDNSGAHKDMDFFTFLISSSALAGSMFRCAAAGHNHQGLSIDLLPVLRYIGRDGEKKMLEATSGVNTQKGLLFLLGVLTAAAAYTVRRLSAVSAVDILDAAAAICQGIVARELEPLAASYPPRKLTAGEKLYLKYGVTGIRGEVEAGMPSIREHGLPVYQDALRQGLSLNDALVHTLMSLMTVVQDTTVLNRHGLDVLLDVQRQAKRIMDLGGMMTASGQAQILALDELFISRNISPGGVADLLAATYFLHLVESNYKITQYGGGPDYDE